jgi:hypothetical protein
MKTFVKQYPIDEGVAVIAAKEPAEIRPLLNACQLTKQFSRDLVDFAMRTLLLNHQCDDCEALLLYGFGKSPFASLAAYCGGLAVIHIRALNRREGDGRAVFIFYEESRNRQARAFACGVFEQIRKEAEGTGAKFIP